MLFLALVHNGKVVQNELFKAKGFEGEFSGLFDNNLVKK